MSDAPVINYDSIPKRRSGNRIAALILLLVLALCHLFPVLVFGWTLALIATRGAAHAGVYSFLAAIIFGFLFVTSALIGCAIAVYRGGRTSTIVTVVLLILLLILDAIVLVLTTISSIREGSEAFFGLIVIFSIIGAHMALLAVTLYLLRRVLRESLTTTA